MRPTRLLAFREHYDCSHGHSVDVWIRPRAPGAAVDPLRRCPTCDTLFVVTDFSGDGLFPTEVKACDDLGNCGRDTGWIDLKQTITVV